MSISLIDKRILITGSTDGLGKETAILLAKEKAQIIIHGRSEERLEQTKTEIEKLYPGSHIETFLCDFSNPKNIEQSFREVEELDVLINNAGIWQDGNTIDTSSEKIIEMVNVNTLAPILTTRLLLPILLESNFAQILNVVSTAGVQIPSGYYHTIYSATKYAMQGFSEALTKEYYNKNLRVMGYYPGGMETNLFKKAGSIYKDHQGWKFDPKISAEAIVFMLTRDEKVNLKRMDLVNQMDR